MTDARPHPYPKHVVNITLDDETDELLITMARAETEGNKSQMVRKIIRECWKRREEHGA